MSKRRINNLLRRKLSFFSKFWAVNEVIPVNETPTSELVKNQFREISRFGGKLVIMQMGN